ncbi:MAG: hypothetical protein IBX62_06380 [Coriobacteriia bacterium]|nr:hypothetical protein [Coriobacteriia bacterium]
MQYAFLIWSLLLLGIWAIVYLSLRDPLARREMLMVSRWTGLLGLTEPVFVPAYWNPPTLFDLAQRTRFDIESVLFAFGVGGLAVILYEWLLRPEHVKVAMADRSARRHRLHSVALVSTPLVFAALWVATPLNPIYSTIIAFLFGGLFTLYCRPDLIGKMVGSALIFTALYFAYFLSLVLVFPDYVRLVWNLPGLSGVLIAGIPIEELLFAFGLGFLWSSVYEHVGWYRIRAPRSAS